MINKSNLNITRGSTACQYVAYYAYRVLTGEPIDGFYFEKKDTAYYLTGYVGEEKCLVLPDSYKGNTYNIGENAFRECDSLTSVTVPNNVISIGNTAFAGCSSMISLTIPNSITNIGNSAFSGCSCLTSLTIPKSVTNIGNSAFSGCSSLNTLTIPNNVTSIENYTFDGCNLKTLVIGAGVLSVGSNQSTPVKTIWLTNTPPSGYDNLEGSVNYVANELYGSMSNKKVYKYLSSMFEVDGITYVPVNPSERTCDVIDGKYDETLENLNIGKTVSYKNIAMTVNEIMPYSFHGNKYVKVVSLNNIDGIGHGAFYNCTALQEAIISNEGNIGESAFKDCTALQKANISNNGNIDSRAFYNCASLQEASISNNGSIGSEAFASCTALQKATISNNGNIGSEAFYYCTALQNAAISNNGSIDSKAFYNCKSLITATLGDSIKSLGGYAFSGCKLLKEIIIPNAVKSIGVYCFENCSAMNKAIIGSGVETINKYVFTGCASLPELTIPKSISSIADYAFSDCAGLKKFVIEDRETTLKLGSNGRNPLFADCPLDYVYIGGDISYSTSSSYGYSPFYRNTSLREVVITDKETEISANEFYGCTNLQNFTVGDGVTTFGDWAFSGCSSLKKLSFGSQLKTIGKEAFSDCVNVTKLISHASTPPTCGSQALDDINKWECTLQVPQQSLAAYQAADQWKEFFFIEGFDTGIDGITVDGKQNTGSIYNLRGGQMQQDKSTLPSGIYIQNGKKFIVK